MAEQRLFVMLNGSYSASSALNMGPLIHRSDDGEKQRLRNNAIIMTVNTCFALFLFFSFVGFFIFNSAPWTFLWLFLIPISLDIWIVLDWSQYKRVRPVTEIYEKGILLQKVSWPKEDGYFWPYEELETVKLKRKTVHLRSKGKKGRASFPLYEIGSVGLAIIEELFDASSSKETQVPQLNIYGQSEQKQADFPES
jgi:hypothetical protein